MRNHRPNHIRKPRGYRTPGHTDGELTILARTKNCRRDKRPRLESRIHIHLGGNRHAILTPGARHNPSKPKEGRLRKRPKEREPLLNEPTFLAPTLQQSWNKVEPQIIGVVNHAFFPGSIFPRIALITSGRCSPADPSSV